MPTRHNHAALLLLVCAALPAVAADSAVPFSVQVLDDQTGRGVPLVELETVNNLRWYTDSHGVAAIDEPDLQGLEVYFHVRSHGYEYPQDGFGYRGVRLRVTPGEQAAISLHRHNIAERLYRLTGAGIYRDSILTGRPIPIRQPLHNAQVFGCDSTISAVYRGRLYWFWGDTNRPQYPLGNFQATGATSRLPADGGLDPSIGVDLQIFAGENGFARGMAQIPGDGATWFTGLTVLKNPDGRETMYAGYVRVRPPFDIYLSGLAAWDDASECFRSIAEFGKDPIVQPAGHPMRLIADGVDYVHFGNTIPFVRVPARADALTQLGEYEAYTCLRTGTRLDKPEIDRDEQGRIRYAWRRDTPPIDPNEQKKLTVSGVLKPHEGLFQLRDRDTGRYITPHFGSCYWNDFRRKFVFVFVESKGESSLLGEVWYAEAESPLGPWAWAVKIITHDNYTFYNPKQHPALAQDGGRLVYIDGTYSHTFSGNPEQTPRYDYNTIMYRLDLGDPRLIVPVAVYREADAPDSPLQPFAPQSADESAAAAPDRTRIAFFACNRTADKLAAVYRDPANPGALTLEPGPAADRRSIAFYALPADAANPPAATVPLFEDVAADGRRRYSVDPRPAAGFTRSAAPVCRVWPNPFTVPRD